MIKSLKKPGVGYNFLSTGGWKGFYHKFIINVIFTDNVC